jgi:hypothetical protein
LGWFALKSLGRTGLMLLDCGNLEKGVHLRIRALGRVLGDCRHGGGCLGESAEELRCSASAVAVDRDLARALRLPSRAVARPHFPTLHIHRAFVIGSTPSPT